MKNSALISFSINILIGLLFSFPDSVISISRYSVLDGSFSQICVNSIADSEDKLKKEFPKLSKQPKSESVKKQSEHFSNYFSSQCSPSVKYFYHLFSDLSLLFENNLNPTFIDLAYLTELEITKMLC